MRVCHVIHNLHPGGAEDLLVDLASVTGSAGVDMTVLSLLPLGGHRHARRLQELGIPVGSLDASSRWSPRAVLRARAAVAEQRPDVVHTHLKHADLVGGLAARGLGVPHVSTLHLIESEPGVVGRGKRQLAAQVRLRSAAHTITVSEAQRQWYLKTFPRADPERVSTVHNGVLDAGPADEARNVQLRAELGVPTGDLLITMVGIMRPGKGHTQLLDALALLGPLPGLTVALVGDGDLRRPLEERAVRLAGRIPRVVFAGFRDDVPAVLSATDLVVHPSLGEALPTALIHALAAGRPVVATAVGGTPEVVVPAAGVLVPPDDAAALAGALRNLLGDQGARARAGAAGRRHYEAEFEARGWAQRLRAVYERVGATA